MKDSRSINEAGGVEAGALRPSSLPLKDLVTEIGGQVIALASKEIELAKCELKADLASELAMLKGLALAAVAALLAVNMLLVGLVLALVPTGLGWVAALVVGGALIAVSGLAAAVGWKSRVKAPLQTTLNTLKDDIQWAKERLA